MGGALFCEPDCFRSSFCCVSTLEQSSQNTCLWHAKMEEIMLKLDKLVFGSTLLELVASGSENDRKKMESFQDWVQNYPDLIWSN